MADMGQSPQQPVASSRGFEGFACAAQCLVLCAGNGLYQLDPQTGNPVGEIAEAGRCLTAVQMSSNELAVAANSGTAHVLRLEEDGMTVSRTFSTTEESNSCALAYFPSTELLAAGGNDEEHGVFLWDMKGRNDDEMSELPVRGRVYGDRRNSAIFLDCDDLIRPHILVSTWYDSGYRMFDIVREEIVLDVRSTFKDPTGPGHKYAICGLCHDSDKQIQFTGSSDNSVMAWDYRTNQRIAVVGNFSSYVHSIACRERKSQVVVPCHRGLVSLIDIRMLGTVERPTKGRKSVLKTWDAGHKQSVYGCSDVEDLEIFVTAGEYDRDVKAWKENGEVVWEWRCPKYKWDGPRGILAFLEGGPRSMNGNAKEADVELVIERVKFATELIADKVVVLRVNQVEIQCWKCIIG